MAQYDFTDKTKTYAAIGPVTTKEDNRIVVMRNVVDFAEQNLGATDNALVMDIPANTLVVCAGVRCITADANCNYSLGDVTTAAKWITETTAADSANAVVISAFGTNATFYATADHLVLTSAANGADTLKVEVFMFCLPLVDDNVKKPFNN